MYHWYKNILFLLTRLTFKALPNDDGNFRHLISFLFWVEIDSRVMSNCTFYDVRRVLDQSGGQKLYSLQFTNWAGVICKLQIMSNCTFVTSRGPWTNQKANKHGSDWTVCNLQIGPGQFVNCRLFNLHFTTFVNCRLSTPFCKIQRTSSSGINYASSNL